MASSRNTSFYITAIISNMEGIIDNYIEQMKKLFYSSKMDNSFIN
jgi:hypothetical protein